MDKLYKKKLEKIFNKVDKLASKGKDNIQEFIDYINELVEKGDYSAFIETVYIFYAIDIYEEIDVNAAIEKSWKEILFQTKTPFLSKLSKLYKQKKVHQQSYAIYSDDASSVSQISLSNKYSVTYSVTGLTPSISFSKSAGNLLLQLNDNSIDYVEIKKATWQTTTSYVGEPYLVPTTEVVAYEPINQKLIDEFYVNYGAVSFTTINLDELVPLQSVTMSLDTGKSFQKYQLLKCNNVEGVYFDGYVNSYDTYNGELSIKIESASGSGTHSSWFVEYVSGTQSPTFSTNVSLEYEGEYVVFTQDFQNNEKWAYKLNVTKNAYLGDIEEIDTFNQDAKYLMQNKQYAKLIGARKSYLRVTKSGATQSFGVVYDNPSYSEDQNLLERYRLAIDYLLS